MADPLREEERQIQAKQSRTPKKKSTFSGGGKFSGLKSGAKKVLKSDINIKGASLSRASQKINPYLEKTKKGMQKAPGAVFDTIFNIRDRRKRDPDTPIVQMTTTRKEYLKDAPVKGESGIFDLGLSRVVAKTLPKVAKSVFPSKASVQNFLKGKVIRKEPISMEEIQAVQMADKNAFKTFAKTVETQKSITKNILQKQATVPPAPKTKPRISVDRQEKMLTRVGTPSKKFIPPKTKSFPKTQRKTTKTSYSRDTMEDLLNPTPTKQRSAVKESVPTAVGLTIKDKLEAPQPGIKDTSISREPKPQPQRDLEVPNITIPEIQIPSITEPSISPDPQPAKPSTAPPTEAPVIPDEIPGITQPATQPATAPVDVPEVSPKTTPSPAPPGESPFEPPQEIPVKPEDFPDEGEDSDFDLPKAPPVAPAPAKAPPATGRQWPIVPTLQKEDKPAFNLADYWTPEADPEPEDQPEGQPGKTGDWNISKFGELTPPPPFVPPPPPPPKPKPKGEAPKPAPVPPVDVAKKGGQRKKITLKARTNESDLDSQKLKKAGTSYPKKIQYKQKNKYVVVDLNSGVKKVYSKPQGLGVNPGETPETSLKVIKRQLQKPKIKRYKFGNLVLRVTSPDTIIIRKINTLNKKINATPKRFRT